MVQAGSRPRIFIKGSKKSQGNGGYGIGIQDLIQILNLLEHCCGENPCIKGI